MCTVTYLPIPSGGYILTSNRDEKTSRKKAEFPEIRDEKFYKILYPRDPVGGGTWMAADNRNTTVCLLNGAFTAHIPTGRYRKSRGHVVLDFFSLNSLEKFTKTYNLEGIEPFTLVVVKNRKIFEFRWDGQKKYLMEISPHQPHIWSSVTLYSPEIIKLRESWFEAWLHEHPSYGQDDIIRFHHFGGNQDSYNSLRMDRGRELKTVSVTSLESNLEIINLSYFDLIDSGKIRISMPILNQVQV